jgi:uroporphyrinogen-III synthase
VVATTRDGDRHDPLVRGLRAEGARVVEWPTLTFSPTTDPSGLAAAADTLAQYDWVVFTSARGVHALAELGAHAPAGTAVAAVGPATAAALTTWGWSPTVAGTGGATALAEVMAEVRNLDGASVLFPAASAARPTLEEALTAHGAHVTRVEAYRTLPSPPDPEVVCADLAQGVDVVTFTSPSAIHSLARALGERWPRFRETLQVAVIGPTTAQAARERDIETVAVASEPTLDSLIDACVLLLDPS